MLTLYNKRHTKACAEGRLEEWCEKAVTQLMADRSYMRCACTFYVEGTLRIDGFVRKSTGETKLPKADEWKRKWEDAGRLVVAPPPTAAATQQSPTVEYVFQQFMNDRKASDLWEGTLKNYWQFGDLMKEFCRDKGAAYITQFGTDYARAFRESWKDSAQLYVAIARPSVSINRNSDQRELLCGAPCTHDGACRRVSIPDFVAEQRVK